MEKIDKLERAFKKFEAEVGIKFKILQQILKTRDEQVVVQQKLLEREHTVYNTLIEHLDDAASFASSGLSFDFSSADVEDHLDDTTVDYESFPVAERKSRAGKRRRRRHSAKYSTGDNKGQSAGQSSSDSEANQNDEHMDVAVSPNFELNNDCDESESLSIGRKVYTEYNKTKLNKAGGPSVWDNYLREDNGLTALCKLCDRDGVQKILKIPCGSTSGLHTHLKSIHKMDPSVYHTSSSASTRMKQEKQKQIPPAIWNYFSRTESEEKPSAKCIPCEKDGKERLFRVQVGGPNTILQRHLRMVHAIDLTSSEHVDDKGATTGDGDHVAG